MKLTESRIKEIILEEINNMNEEDMTADSLEPKAMDIIKSLPPEDQAIVAHYITSLKESK